MPIMGETQARYTPNAGTVEGPVQCGVCGKTMRVERNINGPTQYAEAMSGRKHLHDDFECPNIDKKWHQQVIALRTEIRKTPSSKLAQIMSEEVIEILATEEETKTFSMY